MCAFVCVCSKAYISMNRWLPGMRRACATVCVNNMYNSTLIRTRTCRNIHTHTNTHTRTCTQTATSILSYSPPIPLLPFIRPQRRSTTRAMKSYSYGATKHAVSLLTGCGTKMIRCVFVHACVRACVHACECVCVCVFTFISF